MNGRELTAGDYIRSSIAIIVFFVIFLIATPFILLSLLFSLGRLTNVLIEHLAPVMMRPVFFVLGITLNIKQHGPPLRQPAVYIVNHSSTIDLITILALGLPRVRFVAKWELQYNPLFFLIGRLTGQIFIKRQQSERAVETLRKAHECVKEKKLSILLAPEGSRKHEETIGPFKKGPFRMAMDLGYPIVPIYFAGNRELSAGGSLFGKPGHITAHIYPPIDTADWSIETLEKHIREIRGCYLQWAGVRNDEAESEIKK